MSKEIDVPVGKKFMLAVKSLDMDDTIEVIRVECAEDNDHNHCSECAFQHKEECHIYECFSVYRRDGKGVYFKKIEVVDEELNLSNKNMSRKFDLKAAIKGAKVQTRCGYPVRIVCSNLRSDFPIVGIVEEDGRDAVYSYMRNGQVYPSGVECNYDLVMAPVKRYVNLFKNTKGEYFCAKHSHRTLELAKELDGHLIQKYKGSRYVATIEIEE